MQADAERNALDENGGFYFTMDKNDIPVNEDVDEDGKLTRQLPLTDGGIVV